MKTVLSAVGASLLFGCVTVVPRSATLGQTAAPLGPGHAELALSSGVNAHFESSGDQSASGVIAPLYEGNLQLGMSDQVGLNLHLSPAGVQPGLKISLLRGDLALGVLPEAGVGVWSTQTSSASGGSDSSTSVEFMVGGKVLLSYRNGLYGGVGYDYQHLSSSSSSGGFNSSSTTTLTSHAISLAIGYDFKVGVIRLRPEFGMIISPWNSATSLPNTSQIYLLPTLTVALQK